MLFTYLSMKLAKWVGVEWGVGVSLLLAIALAAAFRVASLGTTLVLVPIQGVELTSTRHLTQSAFVPYSQGVALTPTSHLAVGILTPCSW